MCSSCGHTHEVFMCRACLLESKEQQENIGNGSHGEGGYLELQEMLQQKAADDEIASWT